MNDKLKRILLLLLALALFAGAGATQRSLNTARDRLGLTRTEPLENAPPVLAFTTVALGGFRGLISNALWIRMNNLQDEDRFFEMVQLGDWITKLTPTFAQVWVNQAWNMAYNISVKFKDARDRWRWVRAGIELLRDSGLKYNPNEMLIYRELGWFFQHKMGHNLDDANMYYKQQWVYQMARVFGKGKPNLDELLNPQTDDARARLAILTNEFKMDPKLMKEVDDKFGPLEWRLPEAHAIYWYARGLQQAGRHPEKIKQEDLMQLRRGIYQSMLLSFQRGRLVSNPFRKAFEFSPNLAIISKVNGTYLQSMKDEPDKRANIEIAHRNFLLEAISALYAYNRQADAAKWYEVLKQTYPNKPLLPNDTNSLPANISFDEFALGPINETVTETDRNKIKSTVEGLLFSSYEALAIGEEDRATGLKLMAKRIYDVFMGKINKSGRAGAVGLPPFADIERDVREFLLDPQGDVPREARAVLRTQLGLPAEAPEAPDTNAPALTVPPLTNGPAATTNRAP